MNLNDNNPITADGDYDVTVAPGRSYKLTIKGDWGDGTIQLKANNGPGGSFEDVADGVFSASRDEETVEPVTNKLRFTLSGSTDAELQVHLV